LVVGTLTGSGSFSGAGITHNLNSTIAPDGCFSFANGYSGAGFIEVAIGGSTECTEFDKLQVTGAASINGSKLTVTLENGFLPSNDAFFPIIDGTQTVIGALNANDVTLPGADWSIVYNQPGDGDVSVFYSIPCNMAPTITAAPAGGLWNTPATWIGGVIPDECNDVVIPTGVTVTVEQNGTANFKTIDINANGRLDVRDGAQLIGTEGITNAGTFDLIGNMTLESNVSNTGTIELHRAISGAILNSTGGIVITNETSGTINYPGNQSDVVNVDIVNNGDFNRTGGNNSQAFITGNFTNTATGTIDALGITGIRFKGDLVNDGMIVSTSTIPSGIFIEPGGTLKNNTTITASVGNAGTVFGDLSTFGEFRNFSNGMLKPGNSPGTMTFTGDLISDNGSSIEIEIGGTIPGTDYDQLLISGTALLNGTINLSFINGYTLTPGETIVFIEAAVITGNFATTGVPAGWEIVPNFPNNGDVTLSEIGNCGVTASAEATQDETCAGANDGEITVTANCVGCTSALEYSIDGGSTYQPGNVFSGLGAGNYTFDVRPMGGTQPCTQTATADVITDGTDVTAPVANCAPAFTAPLETGGTLTLAAADLDNTSTPSSDLCGVVTLSIMNGAPTYSCADVGQTFTLTLVVTDGVNLTDNCTVAVTIGDQGNECNDAPIAGCQPVTVDADGNCMGAAAGAMFDNNSNDPDGDQLTFTVSPAGPYGIGTTNVTLTVSDGTLSSTCATTITVNDAEGPVLGSGTSTTVGPTVPGSASGGSATSLVGQSFTIPADGSIQSVSFGFSSTSFPSTTPAATLEIRSIASPTAGSCTGNVLYSTNLPAGGYSPGTNTIQLPAPISVAAGEYIALILAGTATLGRPQLSAQKIPAGPQGVYYSSDCGGANANYDWIAQLELGGGSLNDLSVSLNGGNYTFTPADLATLSAGITDNCTATGDLAVSVSPTSLDCSDIGTQAVTLTVTDLSGNASTFNPMVTLTDDEAPTANCANAFSVNLDGNASATVTATMLDNATTPSSDNCDPPTLSIMNGAPSFGCSDVGQTVTLTLVASDGTNADATCNVDVTITDTNAECCDVAITSVDVDANCPGNIIVNATCNSCSNGLTYTVSGQLAQNNGNFDGLTPGTYTVTVADANDATCVATTSITVAADTEAPTITCPAPTPVTATGNNGAVVTFSDATATDNCSVSVTQTSGITSGITFPLGESSVTFVATDLGNNTDECTFTVQVNGVAPSLQCPENIVVNNDPGVCNAIVDFAATDVAGIPSALIQYDALPFVPFPVGVTTVEATGSTFLGVDDCTFTVTVNDNENPVISCPASFEVVATSPAGAPATFDDATATDNCSATVNRTSSLASGDVFPPNTTPVVFVATDPTGNTATCTFNVTVTGTAPVIDCPDDIVVDNDAGDCGAVVDFAATDMTGVPAAVISYDVQPNTSFGVGPTLVTATATNFAGTDDCTFTVTVNDVAAPVVTCNPTATVSLDASGAATITVDDVKISSSDNCGIDTEVLSQMSFSCTDLSSSAIDMAGNNGWIDFSSSVSGLPQGNDAWTVEAWIKTNNAGLGNIVSWGTRFNQQRLGFGVRDGSIAFIGQSLDWEDEQTDVNTGEWTHVAITFDGVNAMTSYVNGVQSDATTIVPNITGQDLRIGNISQPADGEYYDGQVDDVRIWNVARTAQEIVDDYATPLSGQENGLLVYLPFSEGSGSTTANVVDGGLGTFTNGLDPVSGWVDGPSELNGGASGTVDVTLTVTDDAGLTASCVTTVTVEDQIAPTIDNCPTEAVVLSNETDLCGATYTGFALTASDNCSAGLGEVVYTGIPTNDFFAVGNTMVMATVTDGADNESAACTITVTVNDTEDPEIITCPTDISLVATSAAGAVATFADATATDNCSATVDQTDGPTSGATFPIGVTQVTFVATDPSNNTDDCTFNVTVSGVVPDITCPANVTVSNDAGQCAAVVNYDAATETTGIPASTITYSQNAGTSFPVGITQVNHPPKPEWQRL